MPHEKPPEEAVEPLQLKTSRGLSVNADWLERFSAAGWTTFEQIWQAAERGQLVRDLRPHRLTARVELPGGAVYVKCHAAAPWAERLKAWVRGRRFCWGARSEWEAVIALRAAGLRTMTPVACGEVGARSLLVTAAIDGCWEIPQAYRAGLLSSQELARLLPLMAQTARVMHDLGWQHQDFYLDHFLWSPGETPWLLDLHRAQWLTPLPNAWRVKDLAQLHYSARDLPHELKRRWWRAYLDRNVTAADRQLARQVLAKSARIAQHAGDGAAIDVAMLKRRRAA